MSEKIKMELSKEEYNFVKEYLDKEIEFSFEKYVNMEDRVSLKKIVKDLSEDMVFYLEDEKDKDFPLAEKVRITIKVERMEE